MVKNHRKQYYKYKHKYLSRQIGAVKSSQDVSDLYHDIRGKNVVNGSLIFVIENMILVLKYVNLEYRHYIVRQVKHLEVILRNLMGNMEMLN